MPGICGPLADTLSLNADQVVQRWLKKLSKSSCLPAQGRTDEVIASIIKLKVKTDFPSAVLTLMANELYDPTKFYMHADPVHLRADMDHAVLTSSVDLDIDASETEDLCTMLNQHFEQDGLTIFALNKDQWFISSNNKIDLETTSLVDATGRNINFIMPAGNDAVRWKQILTEAQMLMHSHELNLSRENSGLMSINSLWFHGSGELAESEYESDINLCGDHDMLKGLARHLKCSHSNVPDTVNEYTDYLLDCKQGSKNVLHLTELEHLVNYTDVRPWLSQLAEILDNWIYPLIAFADKNNIKVILNPCDGKKYQFSKYDNLKFWRKGKLEQHVSSY